MIKCTTVGVEPSKMCYEICVLAYKCGALKAWEKERTMSEQITFIGKELFSDEEIAEMKKQTSVLIEKRNWENAFQRWSDRKQQDGTSPYGCCGFGSMCDWCDDPGNGRPCVRALNAMCREKHLTINYKQRDFETLWNRGVPRKWV